MKCYNLEYEEEVKMIIFTVLNGRFSSNGGRESNFSVILMFLLLLYTF